MSKESVYFTLSNVAGKHDVKQIKQALDTLPGVSSVSIGDGSNHVAVDFDTTGIQIDRIKKQLEKSGYEIRDTK